MVTLLWIILHFFLMQGNKKQLFCMRQNPLGNISYDLRIDICLPVIFGKAFLAAALHKHCLLYTSRCV